MPWPKTIEDFIAGRVFAVAGASTHREKYGNKVLRCYLQHGRKAYPVNPHASTVEGLQAYPDLRSLPEAVHGVSIITPPVVTQRVVEDAIAMGIRHVWMQPGAESPAAVRRAREAGINVIGGEACLLVILGFHEH